jgi:hypothetical protein
MEYSSANMKLKNTPPVHLKSTFLKISAIRLSVLKDSVPKGVYLNALHSCISDTRTIING